jgi:hypothetical protein
MARDRVSVCSDGAIVEVTNNPEADGLCMDRGDARAERAEGE